VLEPEEGITDLLYSIAAELCRNMSCGKRLNGYTHLLTRPAWLTERYPEVLRVALMERVGCTARDVITIYTSRFIGKSLGSITRRGQRHINASAVIGWQIDKRTGTVTGS